MNIRIINTPECLCRTCKLYGCEDCPRGKAEEEVMHIKQSASVEKIKKIVEKELDCGLDDIIHYAICTDIAKEISKSIIGK